MLKGIKDNSPYKNHVHQVVFLVLISYFVFYEAYAIEPGSSQIGHPYFWKVEKDGKTSHLLGVVHESILIDELPCSQKIQHSLKNSDLVFVELDHRTERSRTAIETQEQSMLSKDGREFQALSRKSQEFLRNRGVSEQWNLHGYSVLLSNLCKYGVSRIDGLKLDEQITDVAYSKGTLVQELNNFHEIYDPVRREQKKKADFYNGLSGTESVFTEEINNLNDRINGFFRECPPKWLVDATEDYKSGRGIVDIAQASVMTFDSYSYLKLMERNIQWVNRFEEVYQSHERVFLAGGLTHFIFNPFNSLVKNSAERETVVLNPFNVIDFLRIRGYTVERVVCKR